MSSTGNPSTGTAKAFAWIGAIAGVATIATFFGLTLGNDDIAAKDPPQSATPSATAISSPTAPPPTLTTRPPTTLPKPSPPEPSDKIINITAEIDSTQRVGPHRAASCPDPAVYCVALEPIVLSKAGRLGYEGCYLSWALYRRGAQKPLDAGNGLRCNDTMYVGDKVTVPAGRYRLSMSVETDSGQRVTGHYDFSTVNIS